MQQRDKKIEGTRGVMEMGTQVAQVWRYFGTWDWEVWSHDKACPEEVIMTGWGVVAGQEIPIPVLEVKQF